MKKTFQTISLYLIAFISIISCTNDPLKPTDISNIPSNIIVKEKDSNDVFKIVENINLYKSDDNSVYFDSIRFLTPLNGISLKTIIFNQSRFLSEKIIHTNGYFPLYPDTIRQNVLLPDDAIVSVIMFDDNNRINKIGEYLFREKEMNVCVPFWKTTYEDNSNRITFLGPARRINYDCGCDPFFKECEFQYFTNQSGNDSLQIIIDILNPCVGYYQFKDTIVINYTSQSNNTNVVHLSYPALEMGQALTQFPFLFKIIENIPFPFLNSKLIDNVYFTKNGIRYNYIYTFDANNKVKTAKTYNFERDCEQLFEFKY